MQFPISYFYLNHYFGSNLFYSRLFQNYYQINTYKFYINYIFIYISEHIVVLNYCTPYAFISFFCLKTETGHSHLTSIDTSLILDQGFPYIDDPYSSLHYELDSK